MTVSELVHLLQTFPPDAPVGVLNVTQAGVVIDMEAAPVLTVDQTLADDGDAEMVWITGVGDTDVAPPAIVTWPCPCGELLSVTLRSTWPEDHDAHLSAHRAR